MMPSLERFGSCTGYDVTPFREFLDSAWTHLGDPKAPIHSGVLPYGPDADHFPHALTAMAINAAIAIEKCRSLLSIDDAELIVNAAKLALETASFYVQRLHKDAADAFKPLSTDDLRRQAEMIRSQPVTQQELRRQAEDLRYLEGSHAPLDLSMLHVLRREAAEAELLPLEGFC
jgi:hypothetical protein